MRWLWSFRSADQVDARLIHLYLIVNTRSFCIILLLISVSAPNPNSQSNEDANGRKISTALELLVG